MTDAWSSFFAFIIYTFRMLNVMKINREHKSWDRTVKRFKQCISNFKETRFRDLQILKVRYLMQTYLSVNVFQ